MIEKEMISTILWEMRCKGYTLRKISETTSIHYTNLSKYGKKLSGTNTTNFIKITNMARTVIGNERVDEILNNFMK